MRSERALNQKKRAQASLEAIIATSVLLLTMLLIYTQIISQQNQIDYIGSNSVQAIECANLSQSVVNAHIAKNSQIQTSISFDANISQNRIKFQNSYCYFSANPIEVNLLPGNVRIVSEKGVVVVENV